MESTLKPAALMALARPRGPLVELAPTARRFRRLVETQWDELSDEAREPFRVFVSVYLEPEKQSWWYAIVGRIAMALTILFNQRAEVNAYISELDRLVEAIMDAQERSNPRYQSALADAVSTVPAEPEEFLTAGDFREWALSRTK